MRLKQAVYFGNVGSIQKICDKKPRMLGSRNTLGRTVLMQASADGQLGVVKYLVEEQGAQVTDRSYVTDSNSMAIHLAADNGHVDIVEYLVTSHRDAMLEARDKDGDTPLARAAYAGQTTIVEYLIEAGADIESRGYRFRTPIMRAAAKGSVDCVQILLAAGADARAKSSEEDFSKTAAHLAAVFGHVDVLKVFAQHDKQILFESNLHGDNVFCYAALGGQVKVLEYLREVVGGYDLEQRGRRKRTPLMQSASMGHVGAVEYLMKQGAEASGVDKNGKTAADLARRYKHPNVIDKFQSCCFYAELMR